VFTRKCRRGIGPYVRTCAIETDFQKRALSAPETRGPRHPFPLGIQVLHHHQTAEPTLPSRTEHQSDHHKLHSHDGGSRRSGYSL